MKRLINNTLFAAALLSAAVFSSCNSDDTEDVTAAQPSLSVELTVGGSVSSDVLPGGVVKYSLTGTAEGGINTLYGIGAASFTKSRTDLGLEAGATSLTFTDSLVVGAALTAGSTLEFAFVLVDDLNQVDTAVATLTIGSETAKVQTAVLLYAPKGDSTSTTFYSIADDSIYTSKSVYSTSEPVSSTIDLGYYYGNTDKASIASIDAYSKLSVAAFKNLVAGWGTKKATKIVETSITSETYLALKTVAEVETEFASVDFSSQTGIVTGLAVGNVLAFETVEGLKGFIYVSDIKEGFNPADYITLEFILAAAAE